MCLAIFKPENTPLDRRVLISGYYNNPHGAGFAYAKDGELIVRKGFFSLTSFLNAYEKVPEECASIIHFRLASHGKINKHNCHPWQINDDFAMIHNGMFFDFGSRDTSDTGEFCKLILNPLFNGLKNPREDFRQPWLKYMLNATIERGNKIVILNRWGESVILREKDGFWWEGIWYSNSGGLDWWESPKQNKEKQDPITPEDFIEAEIIDGQTPDYAG